MIKITFRVIHSLMFLIFLFGCGNTPTKLELETLYAAPPSKFIEIDGTRIHYRDEGQGPTIVLLHGVLASLHTWDGWVSDLKSDHRIIRFDVPAFGLTGKMGNDDYRLENYMLVIDKFINAVGAPKKFTIVGNSLGGLLAWNYTLLHPDRIEKLALLDAGAYPQELPSILKLMITPVIRSMPASLMPKFMVTRNLKTVYGDPEKIRPETLQLYYDINRYPGGYEAAVKLFQYLDRLSGQEPVGFNRLDQFNIPILVMWGEKDIWVPFNPRWKKDLPRAHYIFYPGVGHVPMEEIAEESVADFRKWYTK